MTEPAEKLGIRFDFNKACWKVTKNGIDLDEEYISCNDAIDVIERFQPRTAELLWQKYFSKVGG